MERVYLTDDGGRIRRYFYPSECRVVQGRSLNLPWKEELYLTKRGAYIMHVIFSDSQPDKWYEIEEQEARFWLARNGIDTLEVEI